MAPSEYVRFKVEALDFAAFMNATSLQAELNKHAMQGWEFVGTVSLQSGEHLVFRRSEVSQSSG